MTISDAFFYEKYYFKNHFLVLGVFIVLIFSLFCGKDKDPVPPTVEEMLASGIWYFESITNVTLAHEQFS
ncbi:MAG: hypothetical protein J0I84_07135 [Terrimonas sp.]|nr:hypothetical protein [Terrimonas sp.]OJY93201.1 MAG: hypothetical protein BGP13_16300 [Sphingobacteriales bacterium 40-81]